MPFKNYYELIPRKYINIPPIYLAINYPKFIVLINKAYMVPSILGGHILQDSTNIGSILSSATVYTNTVSSNENTSSLIPYFKFALVTKITFREFTAL